MPSLPERFRFPATLLKSPKISSAAPQWAGPAAPRISTTPSCSSFKRHSSPGKSLWSMAAALLRSRGFSLCGFDFSWTQKSKQTEVCATKTCIASNRDAGHLIYSDRSGNQQIDQFFIGGKEFVVWQRVGAGPFDPFKRQ